MVKRKIPFFWGLFFFSKSLYINPLQFQCTKFPSSQLGCQLVSWCSTGPYNTPLSAAVHSECLCSVRFSSAPLHFWQLIGRSGDDVNLLLKRVKVSHHYRVPREVWPRRNPDEALRVWPVVARSCNGLWPSGGNGQHIATNRWDFLKYSL